MMTWRETWRVFSRTFRFFLPKAALGIMAAATVGGPAIHAQQVLEIDLEAGRTVIDSEFRSMGRRVLAIDRDREILYVNDREEPHGIMAFSLENGRLDPHDPDAGRRRALTNSRRAARAW